MPRRALTLEEKRRVRDFLEALAKTYPGGYEKLMDDAGIKRNTYPSWRYRTPRGTPSAIHLLSVLETAGVLRAAALAALREAAAHAAAALDGKAEQLPQAGQARRASRRPR